MGSPLEFYRSLKSFGYEKEIVAARIGYINNITSRREAIKALKQQEMIMMVIGDKKHGGVGGIFFDIDNEVAVDRVVRVKSSEKAEGHMLFGVIRPDDLIKKEIQVSYSSDPEKIYPPCFVRAPLRNEKNYPDWAKKRDEMGISWVQLFPSDRIEGFSELVQEAWKEGIRIGGTSLNWTIEGNIKKWGLLAQFFKQDLEHSYWLITDAKLTGVSWSVIRLMKDSPRAVQEREGYGNMEEVCKNLGVAFLGLTVS